MKADMNGVIASVEVLQTNAAAQGRRSLPLPARKMSARQSGHFPDDYEKMTVGTPATITIGEQNTRER